MYVCMYEGMHACLNVCMYVCMLAFFSLKMGSIRCPAKSVNNHQHKLCYIPEERMSQIQILCPVNFRTSLAVFEMIKQQDRHCPYSATLWRLRVIIIAADKHTVLNVEFMSVACRARESCFVAICGLFACPIFFYITP